MYMAEKIEKKEVENYIEQKSNIEQEELRTAYRRNSIVTEVDHKDQNRMRWLV